MIISFTEYYQLFLIFGQKGILGVVSAMDGEAVEKSGFNSLVENIESIDRLTIRFTIVKWTRINVLSRFDFTLSVVE